MKKILLIICILSYVSSVYASQQTANSRIQKQIPTFNLKNKTDQQVIISVGMRNNVKRDVSMVLETAQRERFPYTYTPGYKIVLEEDETVSLYGLPISDVSMIDVYYKLDNQQYKLVAQLEGKYKTIYVKVVPKKDNKLSLEPQEGRWGKTTGSASGYSLTDNVKKITPMMNQVMRIETIAKPGSGEVVFQ